MIKNAHTIATKVYKKGLQTLAEAIKEVEKLQATQQITSTLLPTLLVNTISSDNDRCFNVKKLAIWHAIAPTYGAMTVITMDILPWTAQIRYHCLAHQHATEVMPPTGMIDPPLGIIAMPDILTMIKRIDAGLVIPDPTHITIDIGVAAIMTLVGAAPGHSTDLPDVVSHTTGAQVPTTIAMAHCTADLHPIATLLEMTADLNTNPKSNITNWHKEPHPPHKQHLGNIRIRDTSRSPLMTHPQNTTAQMIMIVTQRMI